MAKRKMTKKQEETLERMKETRINDSIFIRETIIAKLEWAKAEKTKGIEVINRQMQQIKDNKEIISKLDAVINVLNELLEPKKEEPETKVEDKKE